MKKIICWIPPFLWASLIFWLSSFPADELPSWEIPYLDKFVHALEFGILALLLYRSAKITFVMKTRSFLMAFTFLIAIVFALTDEWHQTFVPGRISSPYDLAADAFGILLFLFPQK